MAEQVDEQQLNENMEKIEKNTQETVENGEVEENNRTAELLNGLKITEQEDNNEKEDEELDSEAAKEKDDEYGSVNGRGNEEKKIFCGGISYDTTQEDLAHYFGQFGPVKEAQVKYDRLTGRSRGFAFVEFETVGGCKASLELREQTIKGKQCEIKPAKTREIGYMNKKVFVGGLPGDFPEEELRKHFEQYGRVEDVEWPFDKQSKARKNFAFVVFEAEEAADLAAASPKQQFANRECDVKKAVPQNKRSGLFSRPPLGGLRAGSGAYGGNPMLGGGGGGMRGSGPNALGSHQQMAQMYQNPAAWYQMNATAAWYNAAYNGGAWYGAPGATGGTSNNASAAQWYNSIGNNPAAAAAQASQWYGGNWYNNNGNVAASTNGNGTASGDINGTS